MRIAPQAHRSRSAATAASDPLWPRTGNWGHADDQVCDFAIIGVPTSRTSLSPSQAHLTPAAVRAALPKYSSHVVPAYAAEHAETTNGFVLDERLTITDYGDCADPDSDLGEMRASQRISTAIQQTTLLVTLGGDNAATVPAVRGLAEAVGGYDRVGLVTFDAHHDVREGRSNGSPVARLIALGVDPRKIVQIGIADFANSKAYRDRVREWGITVIHRDEVSLHTLQDVVHHACEIAGAGGAQIHIDVDVDVCDRSVAPGCPASLPGGLSATELRRAIRLSVADPRVRSLDFTEVDATADAADERTVRLVALGVLEAATGLALRRKF